MRFITLLLLSTQIVFFLQCLERCVLDYAFVAWGLFTSICLQPISVGICDYFFFLSFFLSVSDFKLVIVDVEVRFCT